MMHHRNVVWMHKENPGIHLRFSDISSGDSFWESFVMISEVLTMKVPAQIVLFIIWIPNFGHISISSRLWESDSPLRRSPPLLFFDNPFHSQYIRILSKIELLKTSSSSLVNMQRFDEIHQDFGNLTLHSEGLLLYFSLIILFTHNILGFCQR